MNGPWDVAIVGAGYVGLAARPDLRRCRSARADPRRRPELVDAINAGTSHIEDVRRQRARAARLGRPDHGHTRLRGLKQAHAILIALPTPLTKQREPDLSYVEQASHAIGAVLQPGQLVVLESTTYPGTTREVVKPILEEESGLVAGKDFNLAMSPERVDPGRTDWTTKTTPKVVGGLTPACTAAAAAVYRTARRHRPRGLGARVGRADEAAREHLPLGQHRARQRARSALRPDGDRRLGGRRRGRDEAVRLPVVPARPRARRALHPARPLLPLVEGARVRLLRALHRARGRGQQQHAVLLPLGHLAGAEPRAAALGVGRAGS